MPYLSTEVFKVGFVIFLLVVAVYVGLVPKDLTAVAEPPAGIGRAGLGGAVGLVATLTGTGGGAIATPLLKASSMPLKKAIAIASATGLVVGILGTAGYIINGWNIADRPRPSLGYVDLSVFVCMAPTVLFGAPLGARLNNQLPTKTLQFVYAIFLVVVACDMTLKLISN